MYIGEHAPEPLNNGLQHPQCTKLNKSGFSYFPKEDTPPPPHISEAYPGFFFQIWKFACREAMRLARVVRGHAPRENLRFGVYFDPILSLNFFKNY